jgi:hypothetical protein
MGVEVQLQPIETQMRFRLHAWTRTLCVSLRLAWTRMDSVRRLRRPSGSLALVAYQRHGRQLQIPVAG